MERIDKSNIFSHEYSIIIYLMIAKILIHLLHLEYWFHRDEYFYMAVSDQLSLQNLDLPPLTPFVLKFFLGVFGYSIKSLHFTSGFYLRDTLMVICLIIFFSTFSPAMRGLRA